MAFELRQVVGAGLSGDYVVIREGRVFDASLPLWERGMEWALAEAELRWVAPEAPRIGWDPARYQERAREIGRQLAGWGGEWALTDVRHGWVRMSSPTARDWSALAAALVPQCAGWIRGGVADHPLLAGWVARAGASLKLPSWGEESRCWVCPPDRTPSVWATFPLSAVPAKMADRKRWRQFDWHRVGQVPGLAARLARAPASADSVPPPILVRRSWPEPLVAGQRQAWAEMAQEIAGALKDGRWTAADLALTWEGESGPPLMRRRRWPTGTQDPAALLLRALELIAQDWPPPIRVTMEADGLLHMQPAQLHWWHTAPRPKAPEAAARLDSVREVRLAMWDPWRWKTP